MKRWILGIMAVLMMGGVAWAASEQGDQEHDLFLGVGCTQYDEDLREGSSTDYAFQYGGGYFFTKQLSAGIRLGGQYINDICYPEMALNVGPYIKVNFLTDTDLVPYVGMQGGYWWQKTYYPYPHGNHENQGLMWGPIAGMKYYLNEGTYMVAEYQWRMFCGEIGEIADHSSLGLVGIGFTF